jgi:hypothetical protein
MNLGEVLIFNYTGAEQTVTLAPGTYKLECWGGRGGLLAGSSGGLGGYVVGELTLMSSTLLYVYVGGQGVNVAAGEGGWNGGGKGNSTGFGGGGASDIRIGGNALANRIIVAGGGGGGNSSGTTRIAGNGGGLEGGASNSYPGEGGTQTAGGNYYGALGLGGGSFMGGGGGGGYYGGGSASLNSRAGGGGSSYYGTLANPSTTAGICNGDGQIKITMLSGGSKPKRRLAQII